MCQKNLIVTNIKFIIKYLNSDLSKSLFFSISREWGFATFTQETLFIFFYTRSVQATSQLFIFTSNFFTN